MRKWARLRINQMPAAVLSQCPERGSQKITLPPTLMTTQKTSHLGNQQKGQKIQPPKRICPECPRKEKKVDVLTGWHLERGNQKRTLPPTFMTTQKTSHLGNQR